MDNLGLYQFINKWKDYITNVSDYEFKKNFYKMFNEYSKLDVFESSGLRFSKNFFRKIKSHIKLKYIIEHYLDLTALTSILLIKFKAFKYCRDIKEYRLCIECLFNQIIYVLKMNPFSIGKKINEIKITSNNIGYRFPNEELKEIEQNIFININGDVCVSNYFYWKKQNESTSIKNFKIDDKKVKKIFKLISKFLEDNYVYYSLERSKEIGYWQMELTDSDYESYKYESNLRYNIRVDGESLSERIREILNYDNLILFDNREYDKINRIQLDYKNVKNIDNKDFVYTEKLILDRDSNSIEHTQISDDVNYYMKLNVNKHFKDLLEDLYDPNMLDTREKNDNFVEIPNEKRDYEMIVDFKKSPRKVIKGSYDKSGLPYEWKDIIEEIKSFMMYFYKIEVLSKDFYDKPRREYGELIYCKVEFRNSYKYYYYITTDDSISEGDYVLVPAGDKNRVEIVEVKSVEYFKEKYVPYPLNKVKHILRKCTEDEIDEIYDEY
ncbi:hypothetical protein [Parvimonas micra]